MKECICNICSQQKIESIIYAVVRMWPPPNSEVEILMPRAMVLGDVAFGGSLGHKGGPLMKAISVLIYKA